jgi:hypothetical protein
LNIINITIPSFPASKTYINSLPSLGFFHYFPHSFQMHVSNYSLIAAGALLLFTPIASALEKDNLTYDPATCYSSKYEYLYVLHPQFPPQLKTNPQLLRWLATCSDFASSSFRDCSRSVGLATMAPGARNCGCEWVQEQAA